MTTWRVNRNTDCFRSSLIVVVTVKVHNILIMAACVSCFNCIGNDIQVYIAMDIGIELLSILQDRLQSEVNDDSLLCEECFNDLTRHLETVNSQNVRQISSHNINTCISCNRSLLRRRSIVPEGPIYREIATVSNIEIPLNARICYACWFRLRSRLQRQIYSDDLRNVQGEGNQAQVDNTPPQDLIILDTCLSCNISLLQRRTHVLPEGPERNIIAARLHPREIPGNARVCYACWVATRRLVQRQMDDSSSSQIEPAPIESQVPTHRQQPETIHLDNIKRAADTSASCFVPGCQNPERLSVPRFLKKRLISEYKLYIPKHARVCQEHKVQYDWEFLQQFEFLNDFNKNYIEDMVLLSQRVVTLQINFENIEQMCDDHLQFWIGYTKDQFLFILNHINIDCMRPRLALGLCLLKLRTGEPNRRIASLMKMATSRVTKLVAKARDSLTSDFVPMFLGLQHITRQELIIRNKIIPEGLFGSQENRKAIVICDGTYIYVQKSSNYCFQKKTYSLHKYRNLVKPFLFVATDGHILDVFGPYAATVSDSDIMTALFQDEHNPLREYFQPEDVFILDRGFRDAIPLLNNLGYAVYKPETLSTGETQLSTLAANKSRCVTLCRWVVEVVNGRFKRDFKIFRSEYFNLASRHLMVDFRIAAALINAFHPVIEDRPDASLILNRALERLELQNYLAEHVISNNINRRRANFRSIDGLHQDLDIFPQMTMADLILFALGIYQIKQARSYYGEHIRQNGTFIIEVADVESEIVPSPDLIEGMLIRGRIRSRHQSSKVYYTYVHLVRGDDWRDSIKGYYCSCISGKRTVGCCAHTMTLIWYLGWARHQESIEAPASFLDSILISEDIDDE